MTTSDPPSDARIPDSTPSRTSTPGGFAATDFASAMADEIARLANQLFSEAPGGGVQVPAGIAPGNPVSPVSPESPMPGLHGASYGTPFGSTGAVTPPTAAPLLPRGSYGTPFGSPGAIAPPRFGPSALAVGGGGASPAVVAPPVPGILQQPPLLNAPVPKESDLRPLPTLFSDNTGISSPVGLAGAGEPSLQTPYFLQFAGLPTALPGNGLSPPMARVPSSYGAAPGLPNHFFDELPLGLSTPSEARRGDARGLTVPAEQAIRHPSGSPLDHRSASSLPGTAGRTPPMMPERGSASPSSLYFLETAGRPSTTPASQVHVHDFRPEIVADRASTPGMFDPNAVRRDFPILQERVRGRPLVWLDNAATTQKPRAVIDRLSYFYEHENSNIHRAAHALAARATDAYEGSRDKVRRFLNAPSVDEIVFVRGTTEAINLVAQSWGRRNVAPGDEIVITWLEHHANIVPWQMLCSEKGARLRVAPVDARGQVILEEYEKLLGPKTRLVSFSQVSNALGTVTPAREMVQMAHRHGARVLVDGAQAVSHMRVDVQALDCDFYVFSGHKVFGPTGIGALYGKGDVLEAMPPWQGGGNMIADVTFEKTAYQAPPWRFEAGTGNIADAVGLGAALDYLTGLGLENVSRYEHELLEHATERLARVPGLRMIGTAAEKAGVLSFVLDGLRTEDVGKMLDQEGIAVRSGHHCAQPILRRFGVESSVRASLAMYNTGEDIDALVTALLRLQVGRPPRGLK